jgi:hypothetical protein
VRGRDVFRGGYCFSGFGMTTSVHVPSLAHLSCGGILQGCARVLADPHHSTIAPRAFANLANMSTPVTVVRRLLQVALLLSTAAVGAPHRSVLFQAP